MILISIIILLMVFVLIAVRQVGSIKFQIWQIMLLGAAAVLITGEISPIAAFHAINFDVIFFLFGMFIIGQALEDSGYLSYLSYKFFKNAKSINHLLLFILFGFGIASAVLMNDTIAIIGTPVVLYLAKQHKISAKILLLTLAFAVTIGSVLSPIGNPQNLLIALNSGIADPFVTFLKYLLIPTALNLFLTFFLLKLFYKDQFHNKQLKHFNNPLKDKKLAKLSKMSLILVILLIFTKIIFIALKINFDFRLTYIALISALPIILFSPKRVSVLKRIDWYTLIFFMAMFVLMQSVWDSNFFQGLINGASLNLTSISMILLISVLLSQLISNVPLVALYLPLLMHLGATTKETIALAAGSTIAGNLFILGAASNIIIIQNAESRENETITFWEFARIGIPLTILNIAVYWVFLTVF